MLDDSGTSSQQQGSAGFENGEVPFPFRAGAITVDQPSADMIVNTVRFVFNAWPETPFIIRIAQNLVKNADVPRVSQGGLVSASGPELSLKLGWVIDQEQHSRYAAVMVTDSYPVAPEGPFDPRSEFGQVISLSDRCGAYAHDRGTWVWALVKHGVSTL
ncbi:hypothetical protein E1281_19715 [Actinomadura sp. KC345]|uniref:hypothetical protein n=1 Tax=Actinomadura sp. KC345 TaxID=2530371 RepID=UPI00104B274A|nr:hypothetical protein [Actinomadura sp. KC345]TDC51939.1 hypothetical protein E1281_19715 [Actinomadura sp. KC345]